ncbi:hypothetical protein MO973_15285 [Paenibacillus sp. TRM 82003]|nr:hypothetical protein [Paenibacillus sp. TRM 82003]
MDKFWPYVGGLIGGYALTVVSLPIAGLDPILDLVGGLSVIVFAGALVYNGVRALIRK